MNGDPIATEDAFLAMLRATLPTVEPLEGLAFFQQSAVAQLSSMIERFGGAILADDIGLGKSYVAAALARRYQDQGRAVEVIAPASLHEQWKGTLHSFGVAAVIEHSESLHRRPWIRADGPTLIIVDEAHRFRNRKTAGYRALALRCICQPLLLITASPFWNRLADVHALLALFLADDALKLRGVPSLEQAFDTSQRASVEAILEQVTVRRGRSALPRELKTGSLLNRVIRYPVPALEEARPRIDRLRFPLIAHSRGDRTLLLRFLLRRLESSLEAFRDSLSRQRRFFRRAQESMREGRRLTKRDYRVLYGDEDEKTPFQELLFRDLWIPQTVSIPEAAQVDAELAIIEQLLLIQRGTTDLKLGALIRLLENLEGPSIIFTGAIVTARAIHRECERLARVALITSQGAVDARGRKQSADDVFAAFRRREIDVIVSTDRSSEGLNLQVASNVIHYDIPWSPLRLDQRNGRAHRIGRVSDVTAWYFIPVTRESAVMRIVARKNRDRRSLFGRDRRSTALSRWSWIERSFQSQNPLIEGSSFDEIDCGPAILLIEQVTSGRTVRELVLSRQGLIDDSWSAIVSAIDRDGKVHTRCSRDGEFERVSGLIEARARTFALLPAVLPESSSARRLHRRAQRYKLMNRELENLLVRRYPAGIELLMREMSDEYLDSSRIGDLLALLRLRPREMMPVEVRVIAALSLSSTQ